MAKKSDKAAFCVAGKNIARKNVPLMYSIAARHARAYTGTYSLLMRYRFDQDLDRNLPLRQSPC